MKKIIASLVMKSFGAAALAQFQVNPQMGLNFQQLTQGRQGMGDRVGLGYDVGLDLRFGDRLFFQPGAFLGRSATVVTFDQFENTTIESDLVRTHLKLRAQAGYRLIDSYQFDLRFMAGPSYDVLLSVDDKDGAINWNEGDFNKGSFNLDAGLAFDMGLFSLSPTASFGLSRVFSDADGVGDIDSRYITYGLTIGVNFGDDD